MTQTHASTILNGLSRQLRALLFGIAGTCILTICPPAGSTAQDQFIVSRLGGIYEPSGIEHNGSTTLIIEDEKEQPLHLLTGLKPDGKPITRRLDCGVPFDDTEGIASDGNFFYIAGSHHTRDDGKRRKKREFFTRLHVTTRACSAAETSPSLYNEIQRVLQRADLSTEPARLNIEALAWKHATSGVYVALREPLDNDTAILLTLLNPRSSFDKHEPPRFADTIVRLPLAGGGIRAMSFVKGLDGYLIANESKSDQGKMQSRLWYWKGEPHAPVPVALPGFKKLKNVEGISHRLKETREYVMFVCDDGSKKKAKGAHFALIPLDTIQAALKK